jgi:hypothetical protein
MKKAISYSLAVTIAAAGLLLGGNVWADGTQAVQIQAANSQDVSARIEQIREKIAVLTAEIKTNQSQPVASQDTATRIAEIRAKIAVLTAEIKSNQGQTVVAAKPVLTQVQLDQVEVQVKNIAAETARIKQQVAILAQIRAIDQKIAAIKLQIAALNAGKSTVVAIVPAAGNTSPVAAATAEEQKEARIAKIKQQISELTQEMKVQKNLESQNAAIATTSETCKGDSCAVSSTTESGQAQIEISPKTTETATPAKKGFWESVGDFFRKVFTF